jgi:hypothetical protein
MAPETCFKNKNFNLLKNLFIEKHFLKIQKHTTVEQNPKYHQTQLSQTYYEFTNTESSNPHSPRKI